MKKLCSLEEKCLWHLIRKHSKCSTCRHNENLRDQYEPSSTSPYRDIGYIKDRIKQHK